ncbi:MAG TPA: hypothetical protein VE994_07140 [Terriglobales bacterium]|nr:hypothetical protein [Terriglobales bacterium]
MDPSHQPGRSFLKSRFGLIAGAIAVLFFLIWLPPARVFLLISIPIGVVIAVGLHLWHQYKPVKDEDVDERPLKLD